MREERRLRVFENRVLRRIFGPRKDEVTGEWRKLHNEELSDMYSSPNVVRVIKLRMRLARLVARMGERKCAYGVLLGDLREGIHLEDPDIYGRGNIKMDVQEVEYGSMDWNDLAQDRDRWWVLVNAAMNLRVP